MPARLVRAGAFLEAAWCRLAWGWLFCWPYIVASPVGACSELWGAHWSDRAPVG